MLIDSPVYDGAMPICLRESLNDRPRPRKRKLGESVPCFPDLKGSG